MASTGPLPSRGAGSVDRLNISPLQISTRTCIHTGRDGEIKVAPNKGSGPFVLRLINHVTLYLLNLTKLNRTS